MRLTRSTSTLLASAALFGAPFTSAHAVERNLLVWSGKVDREVIIQIRGRDVVMRGSGLDQSYRPRVDFRQALPREGGIVRAVLENGRGDVDVLENPSPRNNYTAVLRVRDKRAGADDYRVIVTYEVNDTRPYPNGGRGDHRDGGGNDDRDHRGPARDDRGPGRDDRGPGRGDRGPNDDDRGGYDRNRRDAGALQWSGLVDGVAEIRIQGSRIDAVSDRGNRLRNVRYDVLGSSLPRRDVRLEMAHTDGRGSVRIVQQPSVWNGYVAVVRIEDGRGGYGAYKFDVRW